MSKQIKPRNIKPDVEADGDSSINTKKGFLISLPSKKRTAPEAGSGIVMAKTVSDTEKKQSREQNSPKNHQKPLTKNEKNKNAKNGEHSQNKPNDRKPENRPAFKNTRPDTAVKADKNEKSDRQEKRDNKQNRRPQKNGTPRLTENERGDRQSQKDNKNRNAAQQRPKDNSLPQKGDHSEKNAGKKKNGKNDRRDRRNKEPKMASLSPLSGDMMAFAKSSKSEDFALSGSAKMAVKEPSLEEKYKDAIPLSEQIAAETKQRQEALRAMASRTPAAPVKTDTLVENAENDQPTPTLQSEEIVGVRFREAGKIYYFDPDGKTIAYGTPVIVETSRGCEYGYVAISNRYVPHDSVVAPLKKLKRIATEEDTRKYRANKELESEAAGIFKEKVKQLGLEMNLVFVEYTFDNSKLLFYFTAESRVDFRELVKELASIFRTRIELRQIGVRDEAKLLGGLGVCGRSVCCNSFLGDFAQVSIKMAKDQGLSLNSAKISGACGKLMCCLRFEDKVYSEEMARTPKVGAVVETADGRGVVTEAHPLKGEVRIRLDAEPEAPAKIYDREDVTVVGFNKTAAKDTDEDLSALEHLEDAQ